MKTLSKKVWVMAIRLFLKGNKEWCRSGHSLIKVFHKMQFQDEKTAAA